MGGRVARAAQRDRAQGSAGAVGEGEEGMKKRPKKTTSKKKPPRKIKVGEDVQLRERLRMASGQLRKGKPVSLTDARDDTDRDTGRETWKEIGVDRSTNRYRERVVVKATGEVLVGKDEPLSGHRGRGSAKGRQRLDATPTAEGKRTGRAGS